MEIIIKMDREEPVKVKTSIIYGEMPQFPDMDKIRDKFWAENCIGKLKEKIDMLEMDLQTRDYDIHDLKLENDRLKQREELMLHFIRSVACEFSCKECDITGDKNLCHYLTSSDGKQTGTRMRASAKKLLSRLEDL